MAEKVLIFGKDTWPFTTAAREAFQKKGDDVDYVNVKTDSNQLEVMLKYSGGKRKVPVIVEGDSVTIGFEGKAWGI